MEEKTDINTLWYRQGMSPQAFEVARGLYIIPRTGWVRRMVTNPETVGEHTAAMVVLGKEIASRVSGLNEEKLLRMLEVHDWPELIEGDVVTATLAPGEREKAEAKKYLAERMAMERICSDLGEEGQAYLSLWLEFEEGVTLEASIAKQIDRLQAMLKAYEYEQAGQKAIVAQRFIDGGRDKIVHPVLLEMLAKIDERKL